MDLMYIKDELVKLKILLFPWFGLIFLLFYDREKEPRSKCRQIWRQFLAYFVCQIGSSPLRSHRYFRAEEIRYLTRSRGKYFFLLALLWIKKLDTEDFKLQQTAAKFSANIISATVYLFVGIFQLRGVKGAAPYGFAKNSCLRGTPGCRGRRKHCGVNAAASRRPPTMLHEAFAETF